MSAITSSASADDFFFVLELEFVVAVGGKMFFTNAPRPRTRRPEDLEPTEIVLGERVPELLRDLLSPTTLKISGTATTKFRTEKKQ